MNNINNINNINNMLCECTHNLRVVIDNDNILICDFCDIRYCKRCKYNSDEIKISRPKSDYYSDNYNCEICDDHE
jgi:hypothetical protein